MAESLIASFDCTFLQYFSKTNHQRQWNLMDFFPPDKTKDPITRHPWSERALLNTRQQSPLSFSNCAHVCVCVCVLPQEPALAGIHCSLRTYKYVRAPSTTETNVARGQHVRRETAPPPRAARSGHERRTGAATRRKHGPRRKGGYNIDHGHVHFKRVSHLGSNFAGRLGHTTRWFCHLHPSSW